MKRFSALLIATACLASQLGTAQAQTPTPLNAQTFSDKIVGQVLTRREMGFPIRLSFFADGRVQVNAVIRKVQGRWWFNQQQQICMQMSSGQQNGQGCGVMYDLGDGRSFQGSQGRVWTLEQ